MTLSELAARAGVPERTARFYRDAGLLGPVRNLSTATRYDDGHHARLAAVVALRGEGVPLKGIAARIGAMSGDELRACAAARDAEVRRRERLGEVPEGAERIRLMPGLEVWLHADADERARALYRRICAELGAQ